MKSELVFYYSAFQCSFGSQYEANSTSTDKEFNATVSGVTVRVHTFEPSELVWNDVDRHFTAGTTLEAGDLNAPHNFVRFHLDRWIPKEIAPKII